MRRLRAFAMRFAGLFGSGRREREMADEFASHLEMHIDDNIRAGMSPQEARRQALLRFGPMEGVKDTYRDRSSWPAAGRIAQDVRFAFRLLRKSPIFSLTAVVTIALGVGVNAAIFSVLNAAALQSLRVPGGDRLVSVSLSLQTQGNDRRRVSGARSMLSLPEYELVRDQSRAFSSVLAYSSTNDVTLGGVEPRTVLATLASCNYFDVLQVRPALGRGFIGSDCTGDGSGTVAVLSHDLWTSRFGSDPAIVGQIVSINRQAFTVAGVAPAGFRGTDIVPQSVFVPLTAQPLIDRERSLLADANVSWLMVIGRLRDGASIRTARADLDVFSNRLSTASTTGRIYRLDSRPTTLAALPEIRKTVVPVATVVLAAVTLVLLLACANIANLLLARSASRRREIAVRMALGAGRARLVQQLLTESLLLALLGGVAGLVAASWASRTIVAYLLANLPAGIEPLAFEPTLDLRVLLYAFGITVATGLAFGLVPALQSTRRDLAGGFRDGAATERRSARRWQDVLVALQVAGCLLLLLSAGLLARGLHRAHTIDPGLAMDDVSVLSFNLRTAGYNNAAAAAFQAALLERLRADPQVRAVAQANPLPLSANYHETRFGVTGTERSLYMEFGTVSPEYFSLLGVDVVRGRTFTDAEVRAESAVIVTESTAAHLWPGEDPLTKSLTVDKLARPVVGVVHDAQLSRLGVTDTDFVFMPAGPSGQARMRVLVRGTAGALPPRALRAVVASLDSGLAITVARLSDNLQQWQAPSAMVSMLAGTLALLALILACTGVFATVAYTVSRRVREIGIRIALGAAREDVLRLIVRQGLRPVAIGIVLGLAGGAAATSLLVTLLFGLSPHDPLSFVLTPAVLAAIAMAACYVPARRALRVDPTVALRAE
jgi:predicted permease